MIIRLETKVKFHRLLHQKIHIAFRPRLAPGHGAEDADIIRPVFGGDF